MYNGMLATKNNEILEKDKYSITYTQNLKKMIQINLYTKQKQTHRHRKQTYGCQWGKGGEGGINWEHGVNRYKLLDKQQGLTVQHKELSSISYNNL